MPRPEHQRRLRQHHRWRRFRGASVTVNTIDNETRAYISGATLVSSAAGITLRATTADSIWGLALPGPWPLPAAGPRASALPAWGPSRST